MQASDSGFSYSAKYTGENIESVRLKRRVLQFIRKTRTHRINGKYYTKWRTAFRLTLSLTVQFPRRKLDEFIYGLFASLYKLRMIFAAINALI